MNMIDTFICNIACKLNKYNKLRKISTYFLSLFCQLNSNFKNIIPEIIKTYSIFLFIFLCFSK